MGPAGAGLVRARFDQAVTAEIGPSQQRLAVGIHGELRSGSIRTRCRQYHRALPAGAGNEALLAQPRAAATDDYGLTARFDTDAHRRSRSVEYRTLATGGHRRVRGLPRSRLDAPGSPHRARCSTPRRECHTRIVDGDLRPCSATRVQRLRCFPNACRACIAASDPVETCTDEPCCLLTQSSASDTDASCECLAADDCAAEAESRRQTSVVSQCPPPAEGAPPACAAEAENCRADYLDDNELVGCCAGSICRANARGVPVCQAASETELASAQE